MVFERALYGLIGTLIFTLISGIIVVRSATKTAKYIEAEKNTRSGDGYDKTMSYCAVTFVASVVFVISLVVLIISLFSFGDTLAWLNHPQAKLVETVIQQL